MAQLGVTYPDGRPLPNDNLPASLLLPMGRTGPAFLAYANFAAYTEWNNSLIYSTTAAYLATRIAGAPPMRRPAAPVAQLPFNEIKELQQLLVRAGFDVGKVDGVLGQQSRTAVKAMQVKYGLPADSWPTAELLAKMRGGPRAQARPARIAGGALDASAVMPRECGASSIPETVVALLRGHGVLDRPIKSGDDSGCFLCSAAPSRIMRSIPSSNKSITCPFTTPPFPPILQMLNSLSGLLTKAEAHCKAKNIQPE